MTYAKWFGLMTIAITVFWGCDQETNGQEKPAKHSGVLSQQERKESSVSFNLDIPRGIFLNEKSSDTEPYEPDRDPPESDGGSDNSVFIIECRNGSERVSTYSLILSLYHGEELYAEKEVIGRCLSLTIYLLTLDHASKYRLEVEVNAQGRVYGGESKPFSGNPDITEVVKIVMSRLDSFAEGIPVRIEWAPSHSDDCYERPLGDDRCIEIETFPEVAPPLPPRPPGCDDIGPFICSKLEALSDEAFCELIHEAWTCLDKWNPDFGGLRCLQRAKETCSIR